ncbi:MAG: peptidoglycan-binding domain-containing protein [Acidobacteriota bacterium]
MRTLKVGMNGEDVRLLHAVLNWHLPPPSDQLPTSGSGSLDFGSRTLAKVKEFQKLNRIDIGTRDFMDGIVGRDTLAVLQAGAKIDFRASFDDLSQIHPNHLPDPFPSLNLPPLVPPPAPQRPPLIPVPKLRLDNVQIQAGASHTINATRSNSDAVFFQASYVILWKNQGPHTEIGFGFTNVFNVPPSRDGNDFQMFGQITRAQIPIFGRKDLSLSFFGQASGANFLPLKPLRPVIGFGAGGQVTWEIIKDTLSIGAQGMPFLNIVNERDPDRPGHDRLRFLTGVQGQGFMTIQLDVGPRE